MLSQAQLRMPMGLTPERPADSHVVSGRALAAGSENPVPHLLEDRSGLPEKEWGCPADFLPCLYLT